MNAPVPPPTNQQHELPELVLEKQPEGVSRLRRRLPPYSGLLIAVLTATMIAIGYAVYRDTHPDLIENGPVATQNPASGR